MKKSSFFYSLIIMVCVFTNLFNSLPAYAQTKTSKTPPNMIWVQGGKTKIGYENGAKNEKPVFETHLAGFWLDAQPVTVGEFKRFVVFARYVTTAEKHGFGACYDSTAKAWVKVQGASWRNPTGKKNAELAEPVRQVSWYDAQAYANWLGKRLPSELEWERALQNVENLKLAYAKDGLWQWCDNYFFDYNETGYFQNKTLNRPKSLRAGKENNETRPSLRLSLAPDEYSYDISFRCAKDK